MDSQLSTQLQEYQDLPTPDFQGTQVQIYRKRIKHPHGYYLEYTKIETLSTTAIPLPGKVPVLDRPISPSFEVLFVVLILLLLPIFTFGAYRYGKKMGKKENSSASAAARRKRHSTKLGNLIKTIAQGTMEDNKPFDIYEGVSSPLILPNNSLCEVYEKSEESQESCLIENEYKENSNLKINSSGETQTTGKGLSLVGQFSTANERENSLGSQSSGVKEDLMKFQVQMTRLYSAEEKNDDLTNGLNEEKLKLHSDKDQVQKIEVKYNLSFENKDGSLQKVERQEVKTTYNPNSREPENNAAMLKKAYDNIQNQTIMTSHNLLRSPENKSPSTALVPYNNVGEALIPVIESENRVCIVEEKEQPVETCVEKSPIKIVEVPAAPEMKNIGFQIDDIPHETGKFAKIFKNVEIVGEGSFGKVYRVIHKLDGKIYAVKKAKFKLDSFEDLQQKSKVFREVFAMTDLHHPNIVRYSTCWVEIEDKKTKKSKAFEKIQPKIVESKLEAAEESGYTSKIAESKLELAEESDYDSSPRKSESSHTNASSLGFEWDVGGDQESKTQEKEKKHLEAVARRMESSLLLKSMTKTLNDENSADDASPSRLSHTGHSDYFADYNLYLYIQMEYCSGQNLRDYLDSPKRVNSSKKSLGMFRKILEGVNAIHKRGILHRDLKPANIFLDENENIKIGDFGLASLDNNEESKEVTEHKGMNGNSDKSYSKSVGTPMYASPEQASGGRYNHKTDIYSLGFILSEMLAGLCTHHERYMLFNKLRQSHELTVDFKKNFEKESDLILRMTAFSPEERPTAEEVLVEIDKLLGDESSPEKKVACR